MRLAIAQINPTLGDFSGNKDKILEYINKAKDYRVDVVVFPECALFGYHPFDLLERKEIVESQNKYLLELSKKIPNDMSVFVGVISFNKKKKGRPYFNSAALLRKNKPIKYFHKQLLPTGDVFDEARFIEPGKMQDNIIRLKIGNQQKKILITICEDIWAWPDQYGKSFYLENPIQKIKKNEVDLVINLSASPFYIDKHKTRESLVKKAVKHINAPMVYVNMVGAQDEIIYDGQSFAFDKKGKLIAKASAFEEDLVVVDLNNKKASRVQSLPKDNIEIIRRALVLGIKDFCKKLGISKVHLGISGGIDSAVVACLAVDALGPQNVTLISMPGPYNLDDSHKSSEDLSKKISTKLIFHPIDKTYGVLNDEISKYFSLQGFGIVQENLQARVRGNVLMAYSNATGSLLLNTSNKTELAAGYSTLYGDLCGGLSPIGDLTKTQVYELARLYNKDHELIPSFIIDRPPSAELRPNQKDQDSLPPYDILDASVISVVEKTKPVKSETDKWLLKKLFITEFKRWQAPPILKISTHSFGRGRRWPIAHRYIEG